MALLVQRKNPLIVGRWGFIDGKNYHVQEPSNSDIQNAMYNGWLHAVFVTGTACFTVERSVAWAKLNFYGSWNDSETSRSFQEKLANEQKNLVGHGVVSDSAFPVSNWMFGRILTPLKEGELERNPVELRPALSLLSHAITSIRQAAEWGMGAVDKVYRILQRKLPFNQQKRGRLFNTLYRLYNYKVDIC